MSSNAPEPIENTATARLGYVGEGANKAFVQLDEQPAGTVRFTGVAFATVRVIRSDEWPAGVSPKGGAEGRDAEWTMDNGYTLPLADFTDKQLQVLEKDGMFSIKR